MSKKLVGPLAISAGALLAGAAFSAPIKVEFNERDAGVYAPGASDLIIKGVHFSPIATPRNPAASTGLDLYRFTAPIEQSFLSMGVNAAINITFPKPTPIVEFMATLNHFSDYDPSYGPSGFRTSALHVDLLDSMGTSLWSGNAVHSTDTEYGRFEQRFAYSGAPVKRAVLRVFGGSDTSPSSAVNIDDLVFEPPTREEILRRSVKRKVVTESAREWEVATFTPNFELTQAEAAEILGYHHFNWALVHY